MMEGNIDKRLEDVLAEIQTEARQMTASMERAHQILHEEKRTGALVPIPGKKGLLTSLMGLGVLLNDVQTCRCCLEDLSSRVPGLNGIPSHLQEQVCLLTRLLFALVEDTHEVERKAWRLAEDRLDDQTPGLVGKLTLPGNVPLALGEGS